MRKKRSRKRRSKKRKPTAKKAIKKIGKSTKTLATFAVVVSVYNKAKKKGGK